MKNFIIVFSFFLALTVNAYASKSMGTSRSFAQPDGSSLMVRLLGDENFSWYETVDGVLLVRVDKSFFVASTMNDGRLANSGVLAHNLDNRSVAEKNVIKSQDKSLFFSSQDSRQDMLNKPHKNISGYPKDYFCPHTGNVRVPVILMDFAETDSDNVKFTYSKEVFEEYFNGTTRTPFSSKTIYNGYGSVSQYFKDASLGQLNMSFDLYGPYTSDKGHNAFGNGSTNRLAFLREAVRKADGDINFADYDMDNDGKVDMVYVLYAGTGANSSNDNTDIWPACHYTSGSFETADGKAVNVLGCANELFQKNYFDDGSPLRAGIGVTCHEMSHGMGLPDLYWTLSSAPIDAKGYVDYNNCGPEDWDLMDGGENVCGAIWPCQYSAWERDIMGWVSTVELSEPADVTAYPLSMEGGKAYRVTNPSNPYEYYVIENYASDGWHAYISRLYGTGLMITHVNASETGLSMSPNNTYGKPNVTIIPADGYILAYYSSGETFEYKGSVVTMPKSSDFANKYY